MFCFVVSFYYEDKNLTFFKSYFNTICPNTFPIYLCELKLLGNLKVFKLYSLGGGEGKSNISIVEAFLHEITEKNSLILTITLEAKIFVQGRAKAFIN